MNDFERELQQELQKFEAPRGFADRVVRRVESRNRERRWWRGSIAAAVLVGVGIGGEAIEMHYKVERQRAQVQREFITAMRVTNKSMSTVQRALERLDKSKDEGEAE